MDVQFEKSYFLKTSDFDCRMKLQPASVLDLFQDAAANHAEALGIGFEAMLQQQLMWVLVKVKYQVLREPEMYSKVRVLTWPLPASRIGFQREYRIMDENGEIYVNGSSEWVLMHSEKRKLMPIAGVYPDQSDFRRDSVFGGKLTKARDFEQSGPGHRVLPGFSQLDINRHVNNTKYADFVLDALEPGPDEIIEQFQIDYHREVRQGTALQIFTHRDGKDVLAKGLSEAGERMFSCQIKLK